MDTTRKSSFLIKDILTFISEDKITDHQSEDESDDEDDKNDDTLQSEELVRKDKYKSQKVSNTRGMKNFLYLIFILLFHL
jgi:hypothetical protein